MNARGERMQPNENLKADLLSYLDNPKQKKEWGKKWEAWQDFFWRHRGRHRDGSGGRATENADAGFNEFLACVAGLTRLLHKPDLPLPDETSKTSHLLAALRLSTGEATLRNIEQYVRCLRFLEDNRQAFAADYAYSDWLNKCLREVWKTFNQGATDWFAQNPGTERNPMTLVWPVLRFMAQHGDLDTLSVADTFRVLRQQYVRYHNYNYSRSVAQLEAEAAERRHDVFSTAIDDEKAKHALYRAITAGDPAQVRRYEEVIWEIEDHPYNLNGFGVGNTNITHLADLQPVPSLEELKKVSDSFYEVLPPDESSYPALQNVLLYYGPYQHRESPWRYFNYNFGDWSRTIRGRGSEEKAGEEQGTVFRRFLSDFMREGISLEELLQKKSTTTPVGTAGLHQKVLWYTQKLGTRVWEMGPYIALEEWELSDANFPGFPVIHNTKGHFKGYGNRKLQEIMLSTPTP